jgi:hypothetical protein
VLVIAIAVPSFSAMKYSSDRALTNNAVTAAVSVARDLAVSSGRGGDGAVAFLFDSGGNLRIVPSIVVGSIEDDGGSTVSSGRPGFGGGFASTSIASREVMVPVAAAAVTSLPAFWSVRGLAEPGSITSVWYGSGAYAGSTSRAQANWVFPESGFYNLRRNAEGAGTTEAPRRSFMIRFDAGTGGLVADPRQALLVDPRPSAVDRSSDPQDAWKRPDRADSLERWALRVVNEPDPDGNGQPYGGPNQNPLDPNPDTVARAGIIGNRSNDTVLLQSVTQLAVHDERELARGIRARGLNAQTRSLYSPWREGARPAVAFDTTLFQSEFAGTDNIRRNINAWVVGDTAGTGNGAGLIGDGRLNFDPKDAEPEDVDEPQARLYTISPYTGELVEVQR